MVVGLQDLHLHWYGPELGSGPPTPLWPPCLWEGGGGVKTGTGVRARNTCGF